MKSKILISLLLVIAIVAGGFVYFLRQGLDVVISEQELQSKVAQAFPINKKYLLALELRLTDPSLVLEEGSNRVKFGLNAGASLLGKEQLNGKGLVSTSVRYDNLSGQFFLNDINIEDFNITGLSDEYKGQVLGLIASGLNRYYKDHSIYQLGGSLQHRAAKLVLKSVEVKNKSVIIHMGLGA